MNYEQRTMNCLTKTNPILSRRSPWRRRNKAKQTQFVVSNVEPPVVSNVEPFITSKPVQGCILCGLFLFFTFVCLGYNPAVQRVVKRFILEGFYYGF
jgi:hypothetical protein